MIQYKTVGGNMQIFKEEKVDIEDALGNLKSAILSYIPFLNLIPYFKKTDSPFVEFHSKQGVTLFSSSYDMNNYTIFPQQFEEQYLYT